MRFGVVGSFYLMKSLNNVPTQYSNTLAHELKKCTDLSLLRHIPNSVTFFCLPSTHSSLIYSLNFIMSFHQLFSSYYEPFSALNDRLLQTWIYYIREHRSISFHSPQGDACRGGLGHCLICGDILVFSFFSLVKFGGSLQPRWSHSAARNSVPVLTLKRRKEMKCPQHLLPLNSKFNLIFNSQL